MKLNELFESLITKIELYGAVGRIEYYPMKSREDKPYRATLQDARTKIVPPHFVKDFASASEAEDWLQDAFLRFEKFRNEKGVKESKDTDFGNYDGWLDAGVMLTWPEADVKREKGPKGMVSKAYVDDRLVGEWDHAKNQGYVMLEGWKSAAANTVAGAALVGAFGAAFHADHKNTKFTNVDGKEYIQHALPSDMSKVKKTKDDKGNDVYVWIEKSGMKPRYTYYWYAPVKKETK